jgi:hypothetical protein
MRFIFSRPNLVLSSMVLVCVVAAAAGTAPGTTLMGEAVRQRAGDQDQIKEAPSAGSIEGRVIDAETSQPLAYANVVLIGFQFGAMTEADGSYAIQDVPPGRYAVAAMIMGYAADTLCLVEVEGGKNLQLSFELEPEDRDRIREIVIGDSRLLCAIHDVPFEWIWVRIVGEPVEYSEAYERARRMIFPHADAEIYNTCLSQALDSMTVLGCPACVEAKKMWLSFRKQDQD